MKRIDMFVPILGSLVIIGLVSVPLITRSVDNIPVYLAGLAAIITSWISLYFSVIRHTLRRPKFRVTPDADTVTWNPKEGSKTYLRLKIENIGQSQAKNCVGRLLEVRHEDGRVFRFDPYYFFWARQDDVVSDFSPIAIYAGDSEFLDIVRIAHKTKTIKFRVSSRKLKIPSGNEFPLENFYLNIAIYADDVAPYSSWFQIRLKAEGISETRLQPVKKPAQKK